MDWKNLSQMLWLSSDDTLLNAPDKYAQILKSRETVFFIVKSQSSFRANFLQEKEFGLATINKNEHFLAWKDESGLIGLYRKEEIFIISEENAKKNFKYISNKPIENQKKALSIISEKMPLRLKDFK